MQMKNTVQAWAAASLILLGGCDLKNKADESFGDQNFKTAIALIELHQLRTGEYPVRLADLRFTGEWDALALDAVKYERLGEGYRLDLARGWMGTPELSYPADFWQGLGIRQSNVQRQP